MLQGKKVKYKWNLFSNISTTIILIGILVVIQFDTPIISILCIAAIAIGILEINSFRLSQKRGYDFIIKDGYLIVYVASFITQRFELKQFSDFALNYNHIHAISKETNQKRVLIRDGYDIKLEEILDELQKSA